MLAQLEKCLLLAIVSEYLVTTIRLGSITYILNEDVPNGAVGNRVNVTQDVLDKHCATRSEEEKMKKRREYTDMS